MYTRPFHKQFELSTRKRVTSCRCLSSTAPASFFLSVGKVDTIPSTNDGRLIRTIPPNPGKSPNTLFCLHSLALTKKVFLIHSIRKSRMEMKSDEKRKEKITIKVKLIAFTQKIEDSVEWDERCRRFTVCAFPVVSFASE